ncbi:hypothetical protein, partial [Salmonella enterica]|uniref:hypothetical protein n=1 Tax=Salmonella enterica TaxID=28901 RepID=UPI001661E2D2
KKKNKEKKQIKNGHNHPNNKKMKQTSPKPKDDKTQNNRRMTDPGNTGKKNKIYTKITKKKK